MRQLLPTTFDRFGNSLKTRASRALLATAALFIIATPALAQFPRVPGVVEVSRVVYDGNTFGSAEVYPFIFNDSDISGIQGSIHIDQCLATSGLPIVSSLALSGITSSFSSKSEGALMLSPNGEFLTYMGYQGPIGAEGVSNSETPGATLTSNSAPTFDREVAIISSKGPVTLQALIDAYSGDNPRASITVDGQGFYMVGSSDSSLNKDGSGPGNSIGVRYGTVGSNTSIQLGSYAAIDRTDERTDESAKQHIKDNNFRGIGIFNGNLYVTKGSGSNGDDGLFQVENGTGDGLPTGTGNTIVQLLGSPATDTNGNPSPFTPFGFFFANATTVYIADEGLATDANGNLLATPDPLAGIEKWRLIQGKWRLLYTLRKGLNLNQLETIPGYPVQTATTGVRNMAGSINGNGEVTLYAITSQFSSISGGEPDPTRLVAITDVIQSAKPSANEAFVTLATSRPGEIFRGVAFVPCAEAFNLYSDPDFAPTSSCSFTHD